MNKASIHKAVIAFVVLLFIVSAIGYLIFPAGMLRVVGITSNPTMDFLARTLAAALLSFVPSAWAVRNSVDSVIYRRVLIGLVSYMFLSSIVDLHGYITHVVNATSVPSIIFRVVLGGLILWLIPQKNKTSK